MAKLAVKMSFYWFGISCSFEFEFFSDLPQFDSSFLADCVKDHTYVLHSPKNQSYSNWKKTSKIKNRNNSIVERAFSYPFFKMYKLLLWWMQHTRLEYIFFFKKKLQFYLPQQQTSLTLHSTRWFKAHLSVIASPINTDMDGWDLFS